MSVNKDELELKAPLVGGDDPAIMGHSHQGNHKQKKSDATRSLTDVQFNTTLKGQRPTPDSIHNDDRLRAAASVFA